MNYQKIKEHFKLTLIYSAVAAIPPVLQVVIQPIIEGNSRLNAEDFALIGMAEMITSLAFTISLFSMGNALSRFFYDVNDDRNSYNSLVSSVFSSILFRGAILLTIAFAFRNQIGSIFSQPELQNFSSYGFAAILTGVNRSINISAATLYRNEKRVRAFVIVNIATAVIRSSFQLLGLFYYEMSFIGYVYGSAVGSSLVSLGVLIYSYKVSGFRYNRSLLNNMNRFAWPLFQYGILTWGLTFADKYFMERYPSDLGVYMTAVNFALGMQIIMQGLQGATQPEIFRFMKDGTKKREDDIKSLSNLLMAQSQALIGLTIIPAMLYLTIFYETDVRFAAGFIAIIFIRYIPRTQYVIFSFPVYYEKKTQFFLYLNLITLSLNVILNFFLIPRFLIYGAVASIMVSDIIQVFGAYFYARKISPIRWNLPKLLYSPLLSVILIIVFEIIRVNFDLNHYISAAASVMVLMLSLVVLYKNDIKRQLKI